MPGNKVLDLGASPGSWTEYMAPLLGPEGVLWAVDERPLNASALEKAKKVGIFFYFLKQSVFDPLPSNLPSFNVVVSDLAPWTQGTPLVDTHESLKLIELAFEIVKAHLNEGGHFVVKLFQSPETIKTVKSWKPWFQWTKLYRPGAVRKESKEIYFIGMTFRLNLKDPLL